MKTYDYAPIPRAVREEALAAALEAAAAVLSKHGLLNPMYLREQLVAMVLDREGEDAGQFAGDDDTERRQN